MTESYDVVAKVISQKGSCAVGHKVGDEWVIGNKTPDGICLPAFSALEPFALVLRCGGAFYYAPDPHVTTVACPDAKNPVVFELSRLQK